MLLSILAILISLGSLIVSIVALYEGRPSVKVTAQLGMLVGPGYKDDNRYLFFNAANKGVRNVFLSNLGFRVVQSFRFVKSESFQILKPITFQQFPIMLRDGEKFTGQTTIQQLIKTLREGGYSGLVYIRAYFTDNLGKNYYSKLVKFDIRKEKEKEKLNNTKNTP